MLDSILSKLSGVKPIRGGFQATCPCHQDDHQSLSISEDNGKLLLYCHAGCSFAEVATTLDLHLYESDPSAEPVITDTYDYTDREGNLLYQVVRYKPKGFKQRRPDGHGGLAWGLGKLRPTLYRLPELLTAIQQGNMITIVEGEKDVETLRAHHWAATTISGGASSKWSPELIPLFANANVCIIPDADEPGRKYGRYVASILYGWCKSLKMVEVPEGKDVSEYLTNHDISSLAHITFNAPEYIPPNVVTREEFESWKGVNRYLFSQLIKKRVKRSSRYD